MPEDRDARIQHRKHADRVVHPDAFLLDQLDLYRAPTLRTLVELVDGYDSPAMTVDGFLLALARSGVPKFVDAVRSKLY
ncbi:hypothetical protein [uncultured Microbacterium sp.]|uniref:hypothetical protein n=1 Tax=uncultured Microbacterium sp. TaxID=191216 RepID=UPI002600E077|nr:hypothetical protein [uncultured Microbacterium sp.]